MDRPDFEARDQAAIDGYFGARRLPSRTYLSTSFALHGSGGTPARFVHKVFDIDDGTELALDGDEWLVRESPQGRVQLKLLISRESGHISQLWLQRITTTADS